MHLYIHFYFITVTTLLISRIYGNPNPNTIGKQSACDDVTVQIVVLTMDRPSGLKGLLTSLQNSVYGCATLNLHFSIDLSDDDVKNNALTTDIAKAFVWKYGVKTITRRVRNAGLRNSWFESMYFTDSAYIAIFEDDMDVSSHWYTFLNTLHSLKILSSSNITNICLHPVENRRQIDCSSSGNSRILWQTRHVCSWGPIWKTAAWMMMVDHSLSLLRNGTKPYIPENVEDSKSMNSWINRGSDVQSVYVKRFFIDTHHFKPTLEYSLTACLNNSREINGTFFGINTKLKGVHYPRRVRHESGELLVRNMDAVMYQLRGKIF